MALRIFQSVVVWLLSSIALVAAVGAVVVGMQSFYNQQTFDSAFRLLWALIAGYAWVVLFVMNWGWIRQHRVSRWQPISGTVAAVAALLPMGSLIFFAVPGILFAIYLCFFHLGVVNDRSAQS